MLPTTSGACSSANSSVTSVDITANPAVTGQPANTTVCQGMDDGRPLDYYSAMSISMTKLKQHDITGLDFTLRDFVGESLYDAKVSFIGFMLSNLQTVVHRYIEVALRNEVASLKYGFE